MSGARALSWQVLSSPRGLLWVLTLAGLSGGLAFVPQLGLLGYFFCLAVSLPLGLGAAHLGHAVGRALRRADGGAPSAQEAMGGALLLAAALAAVPLALITLNGLRVPPCDYLAGLAFYAMGPLMGAVYGAVVGVLAGGASRRAWPSALLLSALAVLALFLPLWRFYTQPLIHLYHPVVGYFSGAIYDEVIEIGRVFIVYRLTNLLELASGAAALVLLHEPATGRLRLRRLRERPARAFWAVLGLGASLLAFASPSTLGYRHDREDIQQRLGGHLQTAHFDLYFPVRSPWAAGVERVAAELERCHADITAALGRAPAQRTAVYVYPDAATKRRLMGADRVYVAKPWRGEVHLGPVEDDAPVIRHELVHALARACAAGPLGVPARGGLLPHMGLVEGLAEALTWRGGRLSYHEASAAMRRIGVAPDLRRLMGPEGFWTAPAGQAYVLSGSFVRWLIERHGEEPLCRLYEDADFLAVYGQPPEALVTGWEAFLDGEVAPRLTEEELQLTRDRFDRPSVFHKVCALEVARREREAGRRAGRRDFAGARRVLDEVVALDPDNPEKRLARAHARLREGDLTGAAAAFAALVDDPRATRVLTQQSRVGLGDVLWRQGHGEQAARRYAALVDEPMGTDARRSLVVKRALAGAPALSSRMAHYLLAPSRPSEAEAALAAALRAAPDEALLQYLLGRRRFGQGRWEEALPSLRTALTAEALDPLVRREAYRLAGIAAARQGAFAEAEGHLDRALALAPHEGERLALRDWQRRLRWWRDRGLSDPRCRADREVPRAKRGHPGGGGGGD